MLSDNSSVLVKACLKVDGRDMEVANVGPDFCYLRRSEDIVEGSKATLILTVEGQERVWEVVVTKVLAERVEFEAAGGSDGIAK